MVLSWTESGELSRKVSFSICDHLISFGLDAQDKSFKFGTAQNNDDDDDDDINS